MLCCKVIIHPFRSKKIWNRPICVLPSVWLLAFLMASPMLAFSTVSTGLTFAEMLKPRKICVEASLRSLHLQSFKHAYGIFTLIFQYVVPFVILVAVYIRICTRIRSLSIVQAKNTQRVASTSENRVRNNATPTEIGMIKPHSSRNHLEINALPMRSMSTNAISLALPKATTENSKERYKRTWKTHDQLGERRQLRLKRRRRANILLTCVSIVFAISWLPLHAVNIFMDYKEHTAGSLADSNHTRDNETNKIGKGFMGARQVTLIQSACLLCVLFSCCVNPLLYGYLNENYRKEFAEILTCCYCSGTLRQPHEREGTSRCS